MCSSHQKKQKNELWGRQTENELDCGKISSVYTLLSNHYVVTLKHIQFLFVNYTSINGGKGGKENKGISGNQEIQIYSTIDTKGNFSV